LERGRKGKKKNKEKSPGPRVAGGVGKLILLDKCAKSWKNTYTQRDRRIDIMLLYSYQIFCLG